MLKYLRNKIIKPFAKVSYALYIKIVINPFFFILNKYNLNNKILVRLISVFYVVIIIGLPYTLLKSYTNYGSDLYLFFLYLSLIPAAIYQIKFKKEDSEQAIINEQNKDNLESYDNLRTHFVLHNIKNSAKNMDWVLDGLKPENVKKEDLDSLRQHLKEIYETLGEYSKFNQIKEKKTFTVAELFEYFDKLVRPSLKAKGIKFFIKSNSKIEQIRINESFYDIFHVFNNLLINAEKALENNSKKEIYLIAEKFESENIFFRICDTGVGILYENKAKIFKVGFSTTNGTGLGLPYVNEILNKIGGKIRFIGESNEFSTIFEVIIPATEQ